MSWLYQLAKSEKQRGVIKKYEGSIVERHDRKIGGCCYTDYYFVSHDRRINKCLSTWDRPKDGTVKDRCVFLEDENDEKAFKLLCRRMEDDVKALISRAAKLAELINTMTIEMDARASGNEGGWPSEE